MAMPDDGVNYPLKRRIAHDLPAWFEDHSGDHALVAKQLETYPPGIFEVDDPDGYRCFFGCPIEPSETPEPA